MADGSAPPAPPPPPPPRPPGAPPAFKLKIKLPGRPAGLAAGPPPSAPPSDTVLPAGMASSGPGGLPSPKPPQMGGVPAPFALPPPQAAGLKRDAPGGGGPADGGEARAAPRIRITMKA